MLLFQYSLTDRLEEISQIHSLMPYSCSYTKNTSKSRILQSLLVITQEGTTQCQETTLKEGRIVDRARTDIAEEIIPTLATSQ